MREDIIRLSHFSFYIWGDWAAGAKAHIQKIFLVK